MDFLLVEWLNKPVWMWAGFLGIVFVLLAFDLGLLNRGEKAMGVARSLWLSAFYIVCAVLFGAGVWWAHEAGHLPTQDGVHAGIAYFTGYFVEKALSIDNVFVISLVFGFFAIPARYQYRVLLWGIIGVIVLRGLMIALGAALVREYGWVLYIFGAFLIITGIKMLFAGDHAPDLSKNRLVAWSRKVMRVTPDLRGSAFFVRERDERTNKLVTAATPLFLALVVVNVADLIFAIDSVPAIFAITTDTFVVYTANIMAVLGLRALYFALAAMVERFAYLKYALALVLVFIGGKIFWNQIVGKVDPVVSLSVTVTLIASGVFYSMWATRGRKA